MLLRTAAFASIGSSGLSPTRGTEGPCCGLNARRSVSRVLSRREAVAGMAIHLGRSSPNASRDRPERRRDRPARRRPMGCRLPLLLGLAPGGVCPAAAVAGGAVRSYRTISPLPPMPSHETRPIGRQGSAVCFCGTFPRVAPAGRYPAPCLRGARTFLPPPAPRVTPGATRKAGRRAAIRPSGMGEYGIARPLRQTAAPDRERDRPDRRVADTG
jgi:hypothetical protein